MFRARIISTVGLSLTLTAAYGDTTNVYCVHPQDSSSWYWLADGDYQISGSYKQFLYYQRAFWGFYVQEEDYQAAKSACCDGWYPQPADSRFSGWRNFIIEAKEKARRLAPGYISADHFVSEMLMPSINFNPYVKCSRSLYSNNVQMIRSTTISACRMNTESLSMESLAVLKEHIL